MKQKTDKKPSSLDIKADKLRRLKEVVPEAFDEDGRLNIPALERFLGDKASAEETRFGLQWHGRTDCIEVAKETKSIATLKPARKESVNFDKTENLFIEGDNLETLKLLQYSYYGKVKMIYIDPPYNTGKEFVYPDKYAETLATYLSYTGQTDENGHKFSTNTEREGRFHSNWLNMMFPRLYLARNLLRNDGVIFISIDDHEQAALKLLCDEIFGEENFIANFLWKKRTGSNDAQNNVSADHDYVLCYGKQEVSLNGETKGFENYSNPDNDPRGDWATGDLTCNKTSSERPNLFYSITDPETGIVYKCSPNRVWGYEKKRMARIIKEGKVIFPKNGKGVPVYKRHKSEVRSETKPFGTIIDTEMNSIATKKLRELMEGQYFDYPKGVNLLRQLIKQSTEKGDIVLDFFAGSCTTAHAVMQLNAEDGGKRKFICVQLPEPTNEKSNARLAGYANIADVGKERIRRAAKQIAKEQNGRLNLPAAKGLDLGFKVLKLAPSNFHVWEQDASKVKNIKKQMKLHTQPLIDEKTKDDDILYEILLWQGLPIAAMPEKRTMEGKTVYAVEGGDTLICLDRKLTRQVIDAMAKTDARRVVCLDAGFQKNDQLKTNATLAFKTKSERKQSEVVFITL